MRHSGGLFLTSRDARCDDITLGTRERYERCRPSNVGRVLRLNVLNPHLSMPPLRALTNERAARPEAAIVTHVPGTTRDILEISLDLAGLPVVVADTAGLRETTDEVEQIGIERARKACVSSASSSLLSSKHNATSCMRVSHRVQAADASLLVLACPDAVSYETPSGPRLNIPPELAPLVTPNTFILLNKTDLLPTSAQASTALTSALPQ